jgi:CheY-like chemotaxis protein
MILILEDSIVNLMTFIRAFTLRYKDLVVLGVRTPTDAIKAVEENADKLRGVLIDYHLNMPDYRGSDFASYLDNNYPELPYVFASSHSDLPLAGVKHTLNIGKTLNDSFFSHVESWLVVKETQENSEKS